jgi:large subunit ribosomal protein L35Ae
MKGKIVNYRRGRRTEHTNQYIVEIEGVADKESANKHLGKSVTFKTATGGAIVGNISRVHGNNGAVIARFDKGLPGQAIGMAVEVA